MEKVDKTERKGNSINVPDIETTYIDVTEIPGYVAITVF